MSAPPQDGTGGGTTVLDPGAAPATPIDQEPRPPRKGVPVKLLWIVGAIAVLIACWFLFRDKMTLKLGQQSNTEIHRSLNDFNDWIGASRSTSPVFKYFLNPISDFIGTFVNFLTESLARTTTGRKLPTVGWLGVVAALTWIAYVVGNAKVALLTAVGFVFIALQGLWVDAMLTVSLTLASVLIALVFSIPLGILAGVSERFNRFVTPILDFMQTMPSYVYLAPAALFFGIGPAAAVIVTIIYAAPPTIRLTAHGIRQVPPTTREAVDSLGVTGRQRLLTVLLPMSKKTTVVGINQTMMAALSMATITALISAPGLGQVVFRALTSLNVGVAFNGGLAIVVLAIVFDRVITAASVRAELGARAAKQTIKHLRLIIAGAGAVIAGVAVYLSQNQLWAAQFDADWTFGKKIQDAADTVSDWAKDNLAFLTKGFKNWFTETLLNPFQSVLTDTPWVVVGAVIVVLGFVIGSLRSGIVTLICVTLIYFTGLWADTMTTLASTLVATVFVMIISIALGVWMGRTKMADTLIRPVLDAAQTLPSFVYLVPFLGLFEATRFTAIIAAVVYAVPVATKIVADGIRGVSANTMEAATSAGSSSWQLIFKVQIPMARKSLVLATNQGLIYVLAMVVVGGLVGGGGLGYLVVQGFVQLQYVGKGFAAGIAVVLLGIMLDRITAAAADSDRKRKASALLPKTTNPLRSKSTEAARQPNAVGA